MRESPQQSYESDASQLRISDVRIEPVFDQDPKDPSKTRQRIVATWRNSGDPFGATTSKYVDRMRPSAKNPRGDVEWAIVGPVLEAWEKGTAAPVNGTPLEVWNGLAEGEVQHLRNDLAIFTLEDFVTMGESAMTRCKMPNIRERQRRAKRYLESQASGAEMQKLLAERDARDAEKDAKIAQLEEMMNEMMRRQSQSGSGHDDERPKRRGRRSKAEIEAEANEDQDDE